MRSTPHIIFSLSWLGISYLLRKLFGTIFILSSGFALGLLTGLFKQITTNKEDIPYSMFFGMVVITSFVLWIIFIVAHRARRNKEERYGRIEYLEELRDNGALSPENFLQEKEKILNE